MRSQSSLQPVPLPRGWTRHVKSALLHAVSLAAAALTLARSRAATSRVAGHRLQAELDRATTEIALLREELAIKDARWDRLPPRRRPFYTPVQRMRILQLKAARGWSREQAARAFHVDEQTLRSWMRRVDEQGERALIQISEPVNRFPDFVRYLVKQLKAVLPSMGKVLSVGCCASTIGPRLRSIHAWLDDFMPRSAEKLDITSVDGDARSLAHRGASVDQTSFRCGFSAD